jgi:signal transduction histidine kinase
MARADRLRGGVQLAMLFAGAAISFESLTTARRSPGFSFAANSGLAATLELAAGWALIIVGALAFRHPARRPFAAIIATAGGAWFVVDWNSPGVGSALLFTTGLVFYLVCPVLVSHGVLRYPDRHLPAAEAIVLGAGYLSTALLGGVASALAFDPTRHGCSECPTNLLLLSDAPAAFERATRSSTYAGVGWVAALIVLVGIRLVRSAPARRRMVAPVLVPAMVYLGAVGLDYVYSTGRGFLSVEKVDRRLWTAQGVLLILIALGTGWAFVRLRLTRTAVARLVVDAAEAQAPGGLGRALGDALGDRALRVLYLRSDGRFTDSSGRATEPAADQAVTRLTRGDSTVAVLAHRPGLLDAAGVADEIADTARLALDNERLQAERHARLADLRASRVRIVAAADAERRGLERDLHDGAQQKLVALSLGLRLARLRLADGADRATAARLDEAQTEVTAALGELRAVARGLYPRELADEGLTAGLETFAESSAIPISVTSLIEERLPPSIESAAYFAVADCVRRSLGDRASVLVTRDDGLLRVEIDTGTLPSDLVDVEDRVGALAGTVVAEPTDGAGNRIRVELPCES